LIPGRNTDPSLRLFWVPLILKMGIESPVPWSTGAQHLNGNQQSRGVVISARKAMDINFGPETSYVIEHIKISLNKSIMLQ